MIRLSLLFVFCSGVAIYAWRDWYKSLCGLILLMAVLEHPDMPKTILGIQGLNVWNILFACILLSWAAHRSEEGLSWDMPGHITILLLLYLSVVLVGFFRMMSDARFLAVNPLAASVSEYLINTVKWVVPGLLLFDGCRSRSRFLLALFSLLALYFLLGLQVIRWIPPSEAVSGQGAHREEPENPRERGRIPPGQPVDDAGRRLLGLLCGTAVDEWIQKDDRRRRGISCHLGTGGNRRTHGVCNLDRGGVESLPGPLEKIPSFCSGCGTDGCLIHPCGSESGNGGYLYPCKQRSSRLRVRSSYGRTNIRVAVSH